MGLLRWLKKNKPAPIIIPVKSRRQSEPICFRPPYPYDPNSNRDIYLRAFEQFHGRRSDVHPHHHPTSDQYGGGDGGQNPNNQDVPNAITDIYATVNRRPAAILNNITSSTDSAHTYEQLLVDERHQQYFLGKTENLHSNNTTKGAPKKMGKNKKRTTKAGTTANTAPNNSVILENEVKEFEIHHCNNTNVPLSGTKGIRSPPSRFFKTNTNPFPAASPVLPPKRTNEHNQRGCVSTKPQNNMRELDRNSVSSGDEGSSSGICSGGSSSDPLDKPTTLQNHILDQRKFPAPAGVGRSSDFRYEKEINKHGDVVEYAMPHAVPVKSHPHPGEGGGGEADEVGKLFHRDSAFYDGNPKDPSSGDEVFVDNSFDFLNECQPSYVLSSHLPKEEDLASNVAGVVRVTDLDESTDGNLTGNSNNIAKFTKPHTSAGAAPDFCQELSILENWSDSLRQCNSSMQLLDKYKSTVALCKPKDIRYSRNSTPFGNRLPSQLEFSAGCYRRTNVTLRKCNPRIPEAVRLVEEAIEKDYNILRSEIKHPSIVLLMAACYNKKLINHMILVLEPCDFTFNYFLHQLNAHLSLDETISLVQQIGSAVQYLHQFGFVHSNLSSHSVLIGHRSGVSLNAKLSSFELATSMNTDSLRKEIEIRFDNAAKPPSTHQFDVESILERTMAEQRNQSSRKENYIAKSKHPVASLVQPNKDHSYLAVPSEFLAYNSNFRQHLSLFNYQAPELLVTFQDFVFPTVASDVYALAMLLWESLNKVVPYVVYSKYELQCLLASGRMLLPTLEPHRCRHFGELIRLGLQCDPSKRYIGLDEFLERLRCIQILLGELNANQVLDELDSSSVDYVNNSRRANLQLYAVPAPERFCPNKPQRLIIPSRSKEVQTEILHSKGSAIPHQTPLDHSTASSSMSEFNRNFKSQMDTTGHNKLTSTLKVANGSPLPKLRQAKPIESQDRFTPKISPKSVLSAEKTRFLTELLDTPNTLPESYQPRSNRSPSVNNFLDATPIRKADANEEQRRQQHHNLIRSAPPATSSYRFEIGDFELPDTPIARENKIRRNAWLSNERFAAQNEGDGDNHSKSPKLPIKITASRTSPASPNSNKVNVNIRIVRTKISPLHQHQSKASAEPPTTSSGGWRFGSNRRNSSDNIADKHQSTKTSLHFVGRKPTKLSYSESMLKKPEEPHQLPLSTPRSDENVTSEFQNCVDPNSMMDNVTEDFEKIIIELNEMEAENNNKKFKPSPLSFPSTPSVIPSTAAEATAPPVADEEKSQWTPVKDTIKQFENWLSNKKSSNSPRSPKVTHSRHPTPKSSKLSEVPQPQLPTYSIVKKELAVSPSSQHQQCSRPSTSPAGQTLIKRTICTETILTNGQNHADTIKNPSSRKQMTSSVTLNLRQTQRQSFGPIDQPTQLLDRFEAERLPRFQQDTRHSIGGNELAAAVRNNDRRTFRPVGSSTELCIPSSGVVARPAGRTYVCCECAEVIPPEQLKALARQNSYASSIMDPRTSDVFCTPLQRCLMTGSRQTMRSTEDFYIDDDFATGLGANMELVSDTSDLFDTADFNRSSAEEDGEEEEEQS